MVSGRVVLGPADGRLRARLFEQGEVRSENHLPNGGWELEVEMQRLDYQRLAKQEPGLAAQWRDLAADAGCNG